MQREALRKSESLGLGEAMTTKLDSDKSWQVLVCDLFSPQQEGARCCVVQINAIPVFFFFFLCVCAIVNELSMQSSVCPATCLDDIPVNECQAELSRSATNKRDE